MEQKIFEKRTCKISSTEMTIKGFDLAIWIRSIAAFTIYSAIILLAVVGELAVSFWNIMILVLMTLGFYFLFFKDLLLSRNTRLRIKDDYLFINEKRIKRVLLKFVSLEVGSVGINGIVTSYRVNLVFERRIFKRATLVPFAGRDEKLAIKTAREVAAFLYLEFRDLTKPE